MYYHASPVSGIQILEPRVSSHGVPLIYFSGKRENTLVYLSNAVEKWCREAGIVQEGPFRKWATYGFDCAGLLVLEEYYPNYIRDTYQGVSGYIYRVEELPERQPMRSIPDGFVTERETPVEGVEYVPDAYEALLEAEARLLISLRRYEAFSAQKLDWIAHTVRAEYARSTGEYREFLRAKFPWLR